MIFKFFAKVKQGIKKYGFKTELFDKGRVIFYSIKKISNWFPFLIFYFYTGIKDPKKTFIVKFRGGFEIKIVRQHVEQIKEIIFNEIYLKFIKIRTPTPLIIDIGANIGIFSIYIAKKFENAWIYSYEPSRENYKKLIENLKRNKDLKIKSFNFGIAGKKSNCILYLSGENHGGDFSLFRKCNKKERIKCIPLKDIFDNEKIKNCDLLKIDAEGCEYEILYNLPSKYFNLIKNISLEYHDHWFGWNKIGDLKNFLKKHGFKKIFVKDNMLYAIKNE